MRKDVISGGETHCFQTIDVRLTFDAQKRLVSREILGGEFISKEDFEDGCTQGRAQTIKLRWFLRQHAEEPIAGCLAFLGVFLLVERMEIRVTIFRFLRLAWRAVSGTIQTLVNAVVYRVANVTTSDLLGLGLIALATAVVVWRVRVRLLERYAEHTCPLCGGDLRRCRRHWSDRLLSPLVPVRRYRCRNSVCRWEGLRANGRT